MSGRCETCKWWIREKETFGTCRLLSQNVKYIADDMPEAQAWAFGLGDECLGEFETEPTFGCVQHEPKDATP